MLISELMLSMKEFKLVKDHEVKSAITQLRSTIIKSLEKNKLNADTVTGHLFNCLLLIIAYNYKFTFYII